MATCCLSFPSTYASVTQAFALFLLVRLLEYASDGYISAAIAKLANYMRLTESLAGSTLLAMSNGASDVITALVAAGDEGDDSLVMGSLFGASIFTTTVCLGIIILASGNEGVQDLRRIRFPAMLVTYLITNGLLLMIGVVPRTLPVRRRNLHAHLHGIRGLRTLRR